MVSVEKRAIPVTLSICWNLLLLADAKPYGGTLPSAPALDSSPWMPIAKPYYHAQESSDNSHNVLYGSPVVPLQTAFVPAYTPVVTSDSTVPAMIGAVDLDPPALQATEAPPAVELWGQQNPTHPDVSDAILPASQPWISTNPLPVVPYWMRSPKNSPMPPLSPISEPAVDVPENEFPQPENPWALSHPSSSEVQQHDNVEANAIFSPVHDTQDNVQDNWPETPRVVAEADQLPALPPATFGQFAVQPAR